MWLFCKHNWRLSDLCLFVFLSYPALKTICFLLTNWVVSDWNFDGINRMWQESPNPKGTGHKTLDSCARTDGRTDGRKDGRTDRQMLQAYINLLFVYLHTNKNKKMSSSKSNENIHKKEDRSYYVVSANKASSVTMEWPDNESQSKTCCSFANFKQAVDSKTDINQNGFK